MNSPVIIAIDGPAGSGKSTLARALADALGLTTLDTGGSYRAVAAGVLASGLDPADADAVGDFAESVVIDKDRGSVINGVDYEPELRTESVNRAVSLVAANSRVRAVLVGWQRSWANSHHGGVVEGRDIGTVVFPDATIKIYLTADLDERARRRSDEGSVSIKRRDKIDSTRAASPLVAAEDAWVIDTTDRSVAQIVQLVCDRLATFGVEAGND